jgi:hypothetical protein
MVVDLLLLRPLVVRLSRVVRLALAMMTMAMLTMIVTVSESIGSQGGTTKTTIGKMLKLTIEQAVQAIPENPLTEVIVRKIGI